jgi:hypothetical protein
VPIVLGCCGLIPRFRRGSEAMCDR